MKEIGVVSDFNFDTSFLFVVLGGSGLFTYLFTLSNMLHWAKKFISKETLKKIYYFLGVVLIALSFYFLITSIITFIKK
jgi:hypothetical protein